MTLQMGPPVIAGRPVRAGLIGCGHWGRNVADAVDRSERFELVSVADANSAAAERLASTLRSRPNVMSPTALIDDLGVDAVLIVTDAATHYGLAMRCLQAGKHTFVEKPLATSGADGLRLASQAAAAGLTLMVGHTFLYSGYVREVDSMLTANRIGELRYIHLERLAYGRFRDDVNVVWNLGPHDVSILMHWAKRPPRAVRCTDYALSGRHHSDVALMTLDFEDWLGHVHLSVVDPQKVRRATVAGALAGIVYDDVAGQVHLTDNSTGERTHLSSPIDTRPLDVEIDHLADCILNRRAPMTDGRHGAWVSAILEAAVESATSAGAWRALEPPAGLGTDLGSTVLPTPRSVAARTDIDEVTPA